MSLVTSNLIRDVTTFDNLSTSYRDAVLFGGFIQADLTDKTALKPTLTDTKFDAAQSVTGKKINILDATRRAGDPARLIADSSEIRQKLNWQSAYSEIETIIGHAWQWELKQSATI